MGGLKRSICPWAFWTEAVQVGGPGTGSDELERLLRTRDVKLKATGCAEKESEGQDKDKGNTDRYIMTLQRN